MSLLLVEGYQKYGVISDASGIVVSNSGATVDSTGGRTGAPALSLTSTGYVMYQLPASLAMGSKLVIGCALRATGWNVSGATSLCSIHGGLVTNVFSAHYGTLAVSASGYLEWRSGTTSGTLVCTSSIPIPTAEYAMVEVSVVLATTTTGSVEIRVNGVTVASATSVVTVNNSAAIGTIALRAPGATMLCDALYACDGTGTHNNNFLGNVAVRLLRPAADTATADWTPSSGGDNYADVDEQIPDGDGTYTQSNVEGAKDLFTHTDGIASSSVHGVRIFARARKADSGTMGFKGVLSSAGTESKTALAVPGTAAYTTYIKVLDADPATGAAWTADAVNAALIGYEATTTP